MSSILSIRMSSILSISKPVKADDIDTLFEKSNSKWVQVHEVVDGMSNGEKVVVKLNSAHDARSLCSAVYQKYNNKKRSSRENTVSVKKRQSSVTIYKH